MHIPHSLRPALALLISTFLIWTPAPAAEAKTPNKPTRFQASTKVERLKFLGWSADSSMYAVETTRTDTKGDGEFGSVLRLREVRDAWTGKITALFLIELSMSDGSEDDGVALVDFKLHNKAAKAAQKKSAWSAFAAKHGFKKGPSGLTAGKTTFKVAVDKGRRGPKLTATKGGASIVWNMPKKARGRLINVVATTASKSHAITGFPFPAKGRLEAECLDDVPPMGGNVVLYPAPDRRRVVIVGRTKIPGSDDVYCAPMYRWARTRVRAAGPQVRVFYAGSLERAMGLVAKLEAAGVTVADVTKKSKIATGKIGYRGPANAGLASKVSKALGVSWPSSALSKPKRWENVEVYIPAK